MLEDPGLDNRELAAAVRCGYGIEGSAFRFVPGHDMGAASYEVIAADGPYFLKVRFGPAAPAALEVPRGLLDAGVGNVLAPIRTSRSWLVEAIGDGRTIVLYPFVSGRSAMDAGMSADQWRAFGTTLRAVHDSGLERRFADRLPVETFSLPSAAVVRDLLRLRPAVESAAATRLAAFLAAHEGRIGSIIERAEELAARLAHRSLARVLCHADIHAANVLVTDGGDVVLVDWDGPMIAPRERDLLFVIGSRIARPVEPREEAWFFEGYGSVSVDGDAIVYYRYERILEDIGVDGTAVLTDPALPESSRASATALVESFFRPGGDVDAASEVTLPQRTTRYGEVRRDGCIRP